MSKSTPGPWMPFATPESSNQAWVVKAGRKRVAAVYCNNPIDRLDARLIAAAPELLEACKIAVELCPCNLRERESGHKLGCYAPMMLAAIQKAEGGE